MGFILSSSYRYPSIRANFLLFLISPFDMVATLVFSLGYLHLVILAGTDLYLRVTMLTHHFISICIPTPFL